MSRFDNKNIIVTGGTSGIGRAAAERLKSEGANVLVTGTNQGRLDSAKAELGVLTLQNNSGEPASAEALAAAAKQHFDVVHGAFINAGFGEFYPVGSITDDAFASQFNVNVRGPLMQAQALAPLLADNASSIVFNTSIASQMGMQGGSIYGATKGALRTVTRVLAAEFAARGIRVNAVSPGPIGTDFFNRTNLPPEAIEGMASQILAGVPLGRFGTPAEVAAVALFLLSADAAFVTGSEYVVDGGMSEI